MQSINFEVQSGHGLRTGPGESDTQTAILTVISEGRGPIGARDIQRALIARRYNLSEATVSRQLRELDDRQLTVPVERKGRILTTQGDWVLRSRMRELEHTNLIERLGEVHTVGEVIHLLRARRAIEPEAVRDGVARADHSSLVGLEAAVREHEDALSEDSETIPHALVLGFHRTVTSFTDNPLVAAMTKIALDPTLDHVETMLDIILKTHHTSRASIDEHARICEAFLSKDSEAAATAMREHLDRLISETLTFVDSHGEELANRLVNTDQE